LLRRLRAADLGSFAGPTPVLLDLRGNDFYCTYPLAPSNVFYTVRLRLRLRFSLSLSSTLF
jgi:hypothetical protein